MIWSSARDCLEYVCYGRRFTQRDLRVALVRACGGYLNSFLAAAGDLLVEDVIEFIEIVAEIHEDPKESGTELWDALAAPAIT